MGREPVVHRAGREDAESIAQLLAASGPNQRPTSADIVRLMDKGQFLILRDLDGELAGAVHLSLSGSRGQLGLVAARNGDDAERVRKRLVGIAEGMCRAQGADAVDLTPGGNTPVGVYHSLGYRPVAGGLQKDLSS